MRFFRNVGRKTATVAAAAAPALLHLKSLSDELSALSKEMNGKLGSTRDPRGMNTRQAT